MKEIDIIDPLTPDEWQEERRVIEQIWTGIRSAANSYFMIVDGLRQAKEKKLYREVGTLKDWALKHFNFGDREYNYYLKAGEVVQNLKRGDPDANPRLTHALAIGMVEPDDQVELWRRIKESSKPVTKKLILEIASQMQNDGLIRARDGVTIKAATEHDFLIQRMRSSWDSLPDEMKIEAVKELVSSKNNDFVKDLCERLSRIIDEE